MECLVIKLPGSATDDTLRKLDEFRFKAKKAGNGSGYSRITFTIKGNIAESMPKLKIVSGKGSLSTELDGDQVQELTFINTATTNIAVTALIRVSESCILGLENCKSITQLGNYENASASFFDRLSSTDSPIISMNISELRLFRHCTNLFINTSGQETDLTGDISVFKDFLATRIRLSGTSTNISEVTGDISVFEGTTKFELRFDFTRIYGNIPDSFVSLFRFDCRGGKIEGNLNKLGNNLTTLFHSATFYPTDAVFKYNFSVPTPKPNALHVYDTAGNAMSGELSDAIVALSTSAINISCISVDSPVNIDIYEVLRRTKNKRITNLTANFGAGSAYSFSGSLTEVMNSVGIGIFNITSKNIPNENAIAILDFINRSSTDANLDKRISLRCDSSNAQITAIIGQLQAKGYIVNIYPLI